MEVAVFAGGCFWCTEAIFKSLKGIDSVVPGYAGGTTVNPNYNTIGDHAETIKIEFDPKIISYNQLLTVFFATHDPTTLNQQGADIGRQYRSMVLYTSTKQRDAAKKFIEDLNNSNTYGDEIVTEIKPLDNFYQAEDYHKNFYANNPSSPYCRVVINPKLSKVKHDFAQFIN